MSKRYCRSVVRCVTTLCAMATVTTAHAHLMVEQHGTINFANGGAFLVLSVPVSAIDGVDDDGDGALSEKLMGSEYIDPDKCTLTPFIL